MWFCKISSKWVNCLLQKWLTHRQTTWGQKNWTELSYCLPYSKTNTKPRAVWIAYELKSHHCRSLSAGSFRTAQGGRRLRVTTQELQAGFWETVAVIVHPTSETQWRPLSDLVKKQEGPVLHLKNRHKGILKQYNKSPPSTAQKRFPSKS